MEDLKKHRHKPHEKLVMYVLVKDGVEIGHQLNCVGHATIACYKKFEDDPATQEWLDSHFYKVTCKVSPEEFEAFKVQPDSVTIREGNIGNEEVAMAFKPRLKADYDPLFKTLKLYR